MKNDAAKYIFRRIEKHKNSDIEPIEDAKVLERIEAKLKFKKNMIAFTGGCLVLSFILLAVAHEPALPEGIEAEISSALSEYRYNEHYNCLKNDLRRRLSKRLTKEEIKAANFSGRANIEYHGIILGIRQKIYEEASNVIQCSKCMPTWGE